MVVTRLDTLGPSPAARAVRDERHLLAHEVGQRELSAGAACSTSCSRAEAAPVRPRGLTRQGEDGVQVEASGPALHVAPVAADVEGVDERQAGERCDLAL